MRTRSVARHPSLALIAALGILIAILPASASALIAPDPGGDPTARVPLPPPGKYMGFNDDSISDLHGLTEVDYAELSRTAGGNLIRASFDWRSAEPTDDYWRIGAWSAAQDLYDRALERGMTPLFTVGFAPTWARDEAGKLCGTACRLPPSRAMDGEWAEFVGRVAEQFPQAIIEVWNEPNLANFWGSGADPQRYAELLDVAHDAVKAASPSTMVLGGALSNRQVTSGGHMAIGEFLSRAYSAAPSIAGNMDALSFHPYPESALLGLNTLFAKSFNDVRATRNAYGDSATPLFVSEVGLAVSGLTTVTEQVQADAMLSMYRRVMTMPDVLGIVFHRLIEPADTTQNAFELGSGWLRYGSSPPAPRAVYCTFVREAGNTYPGCDTVAPETTIDDGPADTSGLTVSFSFSASEAGSTFECRLDAGPWQRCTSPLDYDSLEPGPHTFEARAIDAAGNVDPTPATRAFEAVAPDTTSPAVASLDLSAYDVDVNEQTAEVVVTARITDGESGVSDAPAPQVQFREESTSQATGAATFVRASGTQADGIYEATVTIPAQASPGGWALAGEVRDAAGNLTRFGTADGNLPADTQGRLWVTDLDHDGVPNPADNCRAASNPAQDDHDQDAEGDACDSDDDADGVLDGSDSCPAGATGWTSGGATDANTDGCKDPIAEDDAAEAAEDGPAVTMDPLANDSDGEISPKAIASQTDGAHGRVAAAESGPGLTYTPEADFCGDDSFTYELAGGSTATVTVTVSCVDDAPAAVGDSRTVAEDSSATTIDVLANDSDIDGGPKSVASTTDGAHGQVAITESGAKLSYTPAANFCGSDSFTYELNAGSTATVGITVNCVEDAPAAVGDSRTVAEDSGATTIDVLANDTDVDGGVKRISSKTNGAHGQVAILDSGARLSYTPNADFCGDDSFTYTLNGGSTATVSVTVSCVDDAPRAVGDHTTLAEDAPATVDVLANDTDVDAGVKRITAKTDGAHGKVAIIDAGAKLSYIPAANFCGSDSFTYTLNGGSTATVSVTVSCVDDAPRAVADRRTVAEDSAATTLDVLANDTDVDGGVKKISSKANGAHGQVTIVDSGAKLTYTPSANYCGADSFTYTLNGGSTATVSVTVSCVEDAPSAVGDTRSIVEDAPATSFNVLANDTDVDGGVKKISSKTNGARGKVAIVGSGADVTYAPNRDYCGSDSFTYTLNGGSKATVSVTVSCVADSPRAAADRITLAEDSAPTTIDVLANDPDVDGGTKRIVAKTNGAHGRVAVVDSGAHLTYAPQPNFCGRDSFTYGLNKGASATVSVTVDCVDDAPAAAADRKAVAEDSGPTTIDVLANDADFDAGPKSIASLTEPAHGEVAIAGSAVTYAPEPDFCGGDRFTYALNEGTSASVSVTVSCVDEPAPASAPPATPASTPAAAPASAPDVLAPETRIIDGGPAKLKPWRSRAKVSFSFESTEPGTAFTCALDGDELEPCESPLRLRVKPGKHVLEVAATDPAGNTDDTPASSRFRIRRQAS